MCLILPVLQFSTLHISLQNSFMMDLRALLIHYLRCLQRTTFATTKSGTPEPEKGQGGQTFVEGHRQNFKHVKVLIQEFRGSFESNMSPILSIYSETACFVNTEASSKLTLQNKAKKNSSFKLPSVPCIIFFILEGHFLPTLPLPAKRQRVGGGSCHSYTPVPDKIQVYYNDLSTLHFD